MDRALAAGEIVSGDFVSLEVALWLIGGWVLLNLITFALFGLDKSRAIAASRIGQRDPDADADRDFRHKGKGRGRVQARRASDRREEHRGERTARGTRPARSSGRTATAARPKTGDIQRIPEARLLMLALLGGSVGAYAGRSVFRHKTRKQPFVMQLHMIAGLQLLALGAALYVGLTA